MRRSTTPAFRFTDEEMEIAKGTDLPELLSHLGYQVRRLGNYYTTKEMDSLRIKDRRTWKRYSTGEGGDAITFLQIFEGKGFRDAVNYLLEFNGGRARDSPIPRTKPSVQQTERTTFTLPLPNQDQRRVFAYLQKRGIAPQVIRDFIDSSLLYEDALHHNCVFVGRDGGGKAVFANKRGTYDLDGSGFKGDEAGSDKNVAFRLPCNPALDRVAVFEAPIDLMSFFTLCPDVTSNAVALCGLYSGPLDTYLRENPHLRQISLLLDNDEPGIAAAKEMREKYQGMGYRVEIRVPKFGKDWNQQLLYKLTGILSEPPKKKEKPKKEEPMANIGKMITDKAANDTQRQERRKQAHEHAAELRDAGVEQITTDPEVYARYLDIQGGNPSFSAGNIAMVMMQMPEATIFCTAERWKSMGRSVADAEWEHGADIFTKSASGRSYNLTPVYDITQTQGREYYTPQLLDDSPEMEKALSALLNYSRVPVAADPDLDAVARYDPQSMTLTVNPEYSDSQVFAAVAAEIAQSRFHDRGYNRAYSYESYELNAQSVSCILCRRFGVEQESPDVSQAPELFQGSGPQERLEALKDIQGMSRQIGNAIDKSIAPPQRAAPTRRGEAR